MNVSSQTMSIESTIRALSDDQGVLFPGTGEWDFTQEQTLLAVSRPLQENDIDELFDDQNRLPIEISLENNSKTRTVSASTISFDELMHVGEAYDEDALQLSTHDMRMSGIDASRTVQDTVRPLTQKRWRELISLAESMSDQKEEDVMSDSASQYSDDSLLSENVHEADIEEEKEDITFVDDNEIVTPTGRPLQLGDLGVFTPVRTESGKPAFRRGKFYGFTPSTF